MNQAASEQQREREIPAKDSSHRVDELDLTTLPMMLCCGALRLARNAVEVCERPQSLILLKVSNSRNVWAPSKAIVGLKVELSVIVQKWNAAIVTAGLRRSLRAGR